MWCSYVDVVESVKVQPVEATVCYGGSLLWCVLWGAACCGVACCLKPVMHLIAVKPVVLQSVVVPPAVMSPPFVLSFVVHLVIVQPVLV